MAKNTKSQLNESVTRRFMKLANLDPLAESFVQERYTTEEEVDEVKTAEQATGREAGGSNRRLDEMPGEEMGMEDEDEMGMEPEPEMGMEPEPEMGGEGMEAEVEGLVQAIADAISEKTGIEVGVEGGAGAEMGMDDELPGEEMPDDEMGMDSEMGMDDEEEMMESSEVEEVNEMGEREGAPQPGSRETVQGADKGTAYHGIAEGKEELDEEVEELSEEERQGAVKAGSRETVQGADSPGPVDHNHSDHKLKGAPTSSKNMAEGLGKFEQAVMKRVLERLLETVKKEAKPAKKAKPAARTKQSPRKRVSKPIQKKK